MKTSKKKVGTKNTRNSNANQITVQTAKSVIIGVAIVFITTGLFSFIITKLDMPFIMFNLLSVVSLILGCFTAGYCLAKMKKEKGMLLGAICGGCIFIVIFALGCLSSSQFGIGLIIKLIICLTSGAIGGISGINKRNKRRI